MLKRVALGLICAVCISCVRSNVSSYSNMTFEDTRKDIVVLPYDLAQRKSLEWQNFAAQVEQKLWEAGYGVTKDPRQAELVAFFGYGIDEGTEVVRPLADDRTQRPAS